MNDDFRDFLAALLDAGARFLVVGAHAMAVHGVPRATGDLDVWIATDEGNLRRAWDALLRFGAPVAAKGIAPEDLARPEVVVQMGVPPRRINVLTSITAVAFEDAWPGRATHDVAGLTVPFLGRAALLQNKRATGRAKDRADLEGWARRPEREPRKPRGYSASSKGADPTRVLSPPPRRSLIS